MREGVSGVACIADGNDGSGNGRAGVLREPRNGLKSEYDPRDGARITSDAACLAGEVAVGVPRSRFHWSLWMPDLCALRSSMR
jgi:hypothetical protein